MNLLHDAQANLSAYWRSATVTIAVAGLSRSGKTAFITSIIANLEAAGRSAAAQKWLGGFDVISHGRFHSARRASDFKARHGREFPYVDTLAAFAADEPNWPRRTANVYETAVDVRFWPKQQPKEADAPTARLRLVFVDYPGEWLVDVPMMNQTYPQWSQSALNRLLAKPWSALGAEFKAFIEAHSWDKPTDNETCRRAAEAWQRVLVEARKIGLKWLQPGQFLRRRGQSDDSSVPELHEQALCFCPLPHDVVENAKSGSLAWTMSQRYSAYQAEARNFFSNILKDASRHVLLVDVLEALAEGEHAFRETASVLGEVYGATADHSPSWFSSIFRRSSFEKVLLIATKADTVPPSQRAALASLLDDMCAGAVAANANVLRPRTRAVAAVRATKELRVEVDGRGPVDVVQGLCADVRKQVRVTMIDIPETCPDSDYFRRHEGVRPPAFLPPKIEVGASQGIPNSRIGVVLNDLVGDLLR